MDSLFRLWMKIEWKTIAHKTSTPINEGIKIVSFQWLPCWPFCPVCCVVLNKIYRNSKVNYVDTSMSSKLKY